MCRIYLEIGRKNIKIFLLPTVFSALFLTIILFTVTDLRNCTAGYAAMICQQFFAWTGIFLLSPVFAPEQKDNIEETVLSKSVPIRVAYLIRLVEALAVLLLFTAGFIVALYLLGSEIQVKRYFIHTFASALILGTLGFTGTRFIGNIGGGYIIAFGIYVIQMFLPDGIIEKIKYIYIFTLQNEAYNVTSVISLYVISIAFIVLIFFIYPASSLVFSQHF